MPFISFIIPVYNVKKYLSNCVKSVLSQGFPNWEIILIDDNSTDGSEIICDELASSDDRITCIHFKVNRGPGEARNAGMLTARGDYLYFLDADDEIAEGKLAKLYDARTETNFPDMIYVKHIELFGSISLNSEPLNTGKDGNLKIKIKSFEEFLTPFIKTATLGFYVWQFIIKREFAIKNKAKFRQVKMGEDIDFILNNLFAATEVVEFNQIFYIYRLRISGSLSTTSGHIENWIHIIKSSAELVRIAKNKHLTKLQKEWTLKNVHFLLTQFESIAGSINKQELSKSKDEFMLFKNSLNLLHDQITKNNLLWFIEKYGWQNGPAQFCFLDFQNKKNLLDGKVHRDCYVFPATRKTTRLIGILRKKGYKLKGLIDNDSQKIGMIFDGNIIFNPRIIPDCYEDNDNLFIIIYTATLNTGIILAKQLQNYGLQEGIHFIRAGFNEK